LSTASEVSRFKDTIYQLSHLRQYKAAQPLPTTTGLDAKLAMLRTWQSQRLAHTYADLLASERFGPACRFFLNDIYAPRDFSQRDHDIEYLYELMSHFIPESLLKLVHSTILMNQLTNALDQALLHALVDDLGVKDTITPQLYAEAYRICNNYSDRADQIQLVVDIGNMVDKSTRLPLVGTTLRLARLPAYSAGWGDLHDFLERGFTAFKHMRGSGAFLKAIQEREMDILDRIFAGQPLPFETLED
jgi:hypothetical protein